MRMCCRVRTVSIDLRFIISDDALFDLEVPTFMVAGHETTATGTTWAIHQLTQNPAVQSRLR